MAQEYAVVYSDDFLAHHGVKGQKWGVRRYQDDKGNLTDKGRKRYGYNLDLNDRSRKNVARIRLGEARRRLDYSKLHNGKDNTYRTAELQGRVRSAKSAVRRAGKVDKGAKLTAKGQTILGNNAKQGLAYIAAMAGSVGFAKFLNSRITSLGNQGRLTPGHINVARTMQKIGQYSFYGLATAYDIKKTIDNSKIRAYQQSRSTGDSTIKNFGSQEYKDRVERSKKG